MLFAEEGRKLAVMCPRYNKVLLYDVTDTASLTLKAEIALEGRPVAMATAGQRLVVLQRPPGDDKHLGPGWWESFRFDGSRSASRVQAGYYPDDLAVTPDGRFLLVLSSGQAEGDKKKPLPGLISMKRRRPSIPGRQRLLVILTWSRQTTEKDSLSRPRAGERSSRCPIAGSPLRLTWRNRKPRRSQAGSSFPGQGLLISLSPTMATG